MKEEEGSVLRRIFLQRLKMIRASMHLIERRKKPLMPQKNTENLMARLKKCLPGHVENEERILREIALFAEKIDITERNYTDIVPSDPF